MPGGAHPDLMPNRSVARTTLRIPGAGRPQGTSTVLFDSARLTWQEQHRCQTARVRGTYPDVLEVLAVDRVDDAVGANELDSTVNVHVDHCATLTVLGEGENILQGCHGTPHPPTHSQVPSTPRPGSSLSSRQEWEQTGSRLRMGWG